jgi:hypothetical protein
MTALSLDLQLLAASYAKSAEAASNANRAPLKAASACVRMVPDPSILPNVVAACAAALREVQDACARASIFCRQLDLQFVVSSTRQSRWFRSSPTILFSPTLTCVPAIEAAGALWKLALRVLSALVAFQFS